MKSKLLVPLVLALGLGTSFVNVAEAKTHKHVTATFKTHDGKEIRCLVHDEDKKVLKTLAKGATVSLDAVTTDSVTGRDDWAMVDGQLPREIVPQTEWWRQR